MAYNIKCFFKNQTALHQPQNHDQTRQIHHHKLTKAGLLQYDLYKSHTVQNRTNYYHENNHKLSTIILSSDLKKIDVKMKGLYFNASYLDPLLNIGTIAELFQLCGRLPQFRDLLKIKYNSHYIEG